MVDVVVAPDLLLAARPAHALDHRIVVLRVGENEAVRQEARDRRDGGEIGYPARGEDERGGLAMQVGELGLELHDRMVGAGNVARAAGAGAMGARRTDRGLDHLGMAAHAEIVVRAPDGDFAWTALFARRAPHRHREAARVALEIGEDAIALLRLQAVDRIFEAKLVVHRSFSLSLQPGRLKRNCLSESATCRSGALRGPDASCAAR